MKCLNNLLLNTDSYKASHWLQYPPGTDATFFYVESRGGLYDRTVFYGLQAILKEYLAKPITHADVDEARDVFAAHGEPFNEAGWRYIVDHHGGLLPIQVLQECPGVASPVAVFAIGIAHRLRAAQGTHVAIGNAGALQGSRKRCLGEPGFARDGRLADIGDKSHAL